MDNGRPLWKKVLGSALRQTRFDEAFWGEIEEALVLADIGMNTVDGLISSAKDAVKRSRPANGEDVRRVLSCVMAEKLGRSKGSLSFEGSNPIAVMLVGVNGSGKTTTAAKLTKLGQIHGRSVILGAADTFRAGAIDQLRRWADTLAVPVVAHQPHSDPGAVVYDTFASAQANSADLVIIDTAGRLQNRYNLMQELRKLRRIFDNKGSNYAPFVILVMDGGTGQNGIVQARAFTEAVDCCGVIITKLDGSSKAGFALAITEKLRLPILWVGNGEGFDDLEPFSAEEFSARLLSTE